MGLQIDERIPTICLHHFDKIPEPDSRISCDSNAIAQAKGFNVSVNFTTVDYADADTGQYRIAGKIILHGTTTSIFHGRAAAVTV